MPPVIPDWAAKYSTAKQPAQPFPRAPRSSCAWALRLARAPSRWSCSAPVWARAEEISSGSGTRYVPVVKPQSLVTGYRQGSKAPPVRRLRDKASWNSGCMDWGNSTVSPLFKRLTRESGRVTDSSSSCS